MPTRQSLKRIASSLVAYALLKGPRTTDVIRMLIDTGATTTIIPPHVAVAIGCDPAQAKQRVVLVTASGVEYLPLVTIPWMECLGCRHRNLPVACHDLPPQSTVDGLLGLDFLSYVPAFKQFHREILRLTQE